MVGGASVIQEKKKCASRPTAVNQSDGQSHRRAVSGSMKYPVDKSKQACWYLRIVSGVLIDSGLMDLA
jgi:hypothetical protein